MTLVALGPLTNVALTCQADVATMRRIGRVVAMGGAVDVPGNVTPMAEFNVHVDPEAVARVLDAGLGWMSFLLRFSAALLVAALAAARVQSRAPEAQLAQSGGRAPAAARPDSAPREREAGPPAASWKTRAKVRRGFSTASKR